MQEALFAELAAGARSFACGGPSNAGGLPTTSLRRAGRRRRCARSLKHDGGSGSAVFSSTRPYHERGTNSIPERKPRYRVPERHMPATKTEVSVQSESRFLK